MADIFGADTITPDDNENDITLDTLVGEGRKYKDPNQLAKAYTHADAEIDRLRAQLAEKETEARVLRDLNEARSTQKPTNEQPTEDRQQQPDPNPAQKPEDISELVRRELTQAEAERRKTDNINRAAEVMNGHYGSAAKAQEAIRARAAELGVNFEWLRDAAANSPNAFFATMGINPAARSASTPGHSPEVIRQPQSGTSGTKGFRYFEELRKTSPKAFYSPAIQQEMFAARRELGDKFYTN